MIETTAENLAETKYYEYWGLYRPPFDNVPDPTMYVDCHASMENAVAETLFAIEEGDECISVIVGDVGLGKTLTIRLVIDLLEQEKYKIALITNPGITFIQILQEIIGQLKGRQCEEKRKVNLLETFNKLLFSTLEEGKKILIFIDECNAISPENLENLRLLTNMQGDGRNLFTMVLAGQIEFAKRLEHPSRANLFQRVGTYCKITRFESVSVVRKYVESRMKLSGAARQIFTDDAFNKIWENSDGGVPRLINKLCKLCLKAGETNNLSSIVGEVVDQIGSRFNKMTRPNVQRRLPAQIPGKALSSAAREPSGHDVVRDISEAREEHDDEPNQEAHSQPEEDVSDAAMTMTESIGDRAGNTEGIVSIPQPERISGEQEQIKQGQVDDEMDERISLQLEEGLPAPQEDLKLTEPGKVVQGEIPSSKGESLSAGQESATGGGFGDKVAEVPAFSQQMSVPAGETSAEHAQPDKEEMASGAEGCLATDREDAKLSGPDKEPQKRPAPLQEGDASKGQEEERIAKFDNQIEEVSPLVQQQSMPVREKSAGQVQPDQRMGEGKSLGVPGGRSAGKEETKTSEAGKEGLQERLARLHQRRIPEEPVNAKANCPDELEIHGCRIKIDFPEDVLKQSKSSTVEYRFKMAGMLAAEALKKNSHLITSYTVDPVPIWQEIRDYVLNRFNQTMI
jgi:type II secretory pathway predicted ATPase ExeA